jgi:hypothetical protein
MSEINPSNASTHLERDYGADGADGADDADDACPGPIFHREYYDELQAVIEKRLKGLDNKEAESGAVGYRVAGETAEEPEWHQQLSAAIYSSGGDYPDDECADHANDSMHDSLSRAQGSLRRATASELGAAQTAIDAHKRSARCNYCRV